VGPDVEHPHDVPLGVEQRGEEQLLLGLRLAAEGTFGDALHGLIDLELRRGGESLL
jgi:hypothetical protein